MNREPWGVALVVGAVGDGLEGVEHDARSMEAMFRARGFAVDVRTGARATRDGILGGYDELIARVRPGEPAAFYYSGHGFHAFVDDEAAAWQGICPTDLAASTTEDFRGITAWELSIKLAQLTAKTRNATVILDCCHAAYMSRGEAVAKAVVLPHPARLGFTAHIRALRARYGRAFDDVDPVGNRDAVRLVACGQTEVAFEYPGDDGRRRAVFTEALLAALQDDPRSWASVDDEVRARVQRRFPAQRPDVEGPAHRRVFSLDEEDPSAIATEDRLAPLLPTLRAREVRPGAIERLTSLGLPQAIRALEGEHGVSARDVEIEWGTVVRGEMMRMPDHGASLALRDRLYVRIRSTSPQPRFAHILNIGIRDAVTLLTSYAPAGVALTPEQPELVLGRRSDGVLLGQVLRWPGTMPRSAAPRIDEVVIIVATNRASLRSLETSEHPRSVRTAERVDGRGMDPAVSAAEWQHGSIDGFLVKSLSYLLHARDEAMRQ